MTAKKKNTGFLAFLKSRTFFIHLGLLMMVLGGLLWLLMWSLKLYTLHGQELNLPDLRGMTPESFETLLEEKELRYKIVDSVYTPDLPPLAVVEQIPKPHSKVKQNRQVYLTVNATQPPQVPIPNVVDHSLRAAIGMLEISGLEVGELIYRPSFAQNAVLEQQVDGEQIEAGEMVRKGTQVDLVLGSGLGEETVPVPKLKGLTKGEARYVLQATSLNLGAALYEGDITDTAAARVFKQRPVSNMELSLGESVDIFLKEGVKPARAPAEPGEDRIGDTLGL